MGKYLDKAKQLYSKHQIWLFVLPALVYYAVFRYKPLYFLQIAFKDFRITRSLANSPFVGFQHFVTLFSSPDFMNALINTIIIGTYKLVFGFPLPIILALMLNELRSVAFKRVAQSIVYLPHFISWSVMAGIFYNILSIHSGLFNELLVWFGREPIFFMGDKSYFRSVLVGTDIWKTTGYGTILYLAALARIDKALYEAAYIDGANKLQRLRYITLPGIVSIIVVLFILNVGKFLEVGFEQILVLGNPMVRSVSDVIDTYVYRMGLQQGNYSLATAAGLFKTIVATIMVVTCDRLAKLMGDQGII